LKIDCREAQAKLRRQTLQRDTGNAHAMAAMRKFKRLGRSVM
jgi:hypothetical protein